MRLLLFLSVAALAVGQELTLTAPWLMVYDPEGRPRWEIRLEKLWRAKGGWEGEGVRLTLFYEGEPSFSVQARRIRAEALGRSWTLLDGLEGQGHGFVFAAEEASWEGRLGLRRFRAEGQGLILTAKEARWELHGPLELVEAQAEGRGWTVRFAFGRYSEGLLLAQEAEAWGHGLHLSAEFLEFWAEEGRLKFRRVQIVRRS